jgi:hypothetical protein
MAITNFQSAMYNFAEEVRNRWLERTAAHEEREEFQPVSVSFRPVYYPSNHISKGQRLANMGTFKSFMVRVMFTGADLHRFWPKTIKSPDFYGFRAFYGSY